MSIKLATELNDTTTVATWSSSLKGIKKAVNEQLWDPTENLFFDNDVNRTSTSLHPQDGNSWVIMSGLVDPARAANISTALQARWIRPYGAPAPEAGATISPFASGFEVQAHFLAGCPQRAIDLIEFMWADFMLDDPRMTNSSFIEGYATNGDLHYAPYDNDARISHAHGWATGPTSALTFLVAGLQLSSKEGKTWVLQPRLGSLRYVKAGYKTGLGEFTVDWSGEGEGTKLMGNFSTPKGTMGSLILPAGSQIILDGPHGCVKSGTNSISGQVIFANIPGGSYRVRSP